MLAPTPTVCPHCNHGLFSDHYLDRVLPQRQDWRGLGVSALPVMEQLSAIFEAYRPSSNEAQTEQDLAAGLKVLRASYEEQTTLVREGGAEAAKLERRLSGLVNAAYGLTPEEINLLWATAPPRMLRF